MREELTFKDHRILEMEEVVKQEKEAVSAHEGEVQSLLDKLTLEVERNTRLSLELQEGNTGSEVRNQANSVDTYVCMCTRLVGREGGRVPSKINVKVFL